MKNIFNKIKYYARLTYFIHVGEKINIIAKFFTFIAIFYAFSPIDLIPDFIPVVGFLDDLLILPLFVFLGLLFTSKESKEVAAVKARDNSIKIEKKWYYSTVVITLWIIMLYFIIKEVL